MSIPAVSVLVVSYRVKDLLRRCLETLRAQRGVEFDVWVLDNDSGDGSADMVETTFPECHLVRSGENLGFARANNRLIDRAQGRLLALVNPDTELPPDALAVAVEVLGRHPGAAVAGLALRNTDGTPQLSCFAFPDPLNLLVESLGLHRALVHAGFATPSAAPEPRHGEGSVPWVSGAFFVMRREAVERVGALDEGQLMYGEEMDWCWRARRAGFDVVWSDRARVLHHGGASGRDARGALFVKNLEGRMTFLRRHRGGFAAAFGLELMTLAAAIRLPYWRWRAARDGTGASEWTRDQVERFEAVLAWRRGMKG